MDDLQLGVEQLSYHTHQIFCSLAFLSYHNFIHAYPWHGFFLDSLPASITYFKKLIGASSTEIANFL